MFEYRRPREKPLILLVDDDSTVRFLLGNVLREGGFEVKEAADGAVGIDLAREIAPDLVILDVMMPGLDGYETCQALRAIAACADVPVLMLTGLDDVHSFRRAFEAGATDFATKPISPAMLSHRVRFMLRARDIFSELRQSESRLAEAQRIARIGHWEFDLGTGAFHGSAEVNSILGLAAGAAVSFEDCLARVHPDYRATLRQAVDSLARGEEALDHQHRLVTETGEPRFIHLRGELVRGPDGASRCARGTLQDITDRVRAEEQIRLLVYHDSLTGLPNRLLCARKLETALAHARRRGRKVAMMVLDLNNFRQINDTLGHRAGDVVLAAVARRLRDSVRAFDEMVSNGKQENASITSRLAGDEFLFAIMDLESGEEAADIAQHILDTLHEPVKHESRELFVSGSIGVSLFPDDGADFEELVKNADTAVAQAKQSGPNTIAFFNRSMNELVTHRLMLETELRRTLENHGIKVHYQPLVEAANGRIVGIEALSRWTHSQLGVVSPVQFIPLAERLGLIGTLTEDTVRSACSQLAAWGRVGLPPIYVSINISGQQFQNPDLATGICSLVGEAGVDPGRITLEVTESVLIMNLTAGERTLESLKACGFRIAIDDFGTGYSSLSYIKRFPIDVLKIDRAFIRDIATNPRDATVTTAIVALAQGLGVEPLAEGVETAEQRDMLLAAGCSLMQGFFFAKPMPAENLAVLLRLGPGALYPTIPDFSVLAA
jgi:diguanylate cyclase (GGDEF)-like protein/PAS domain S-box-containing protein